MKVYRKIGARSENVARDADKTLKNDDIVLLTWHANHRDSKQRDEQRRKLFETPQSAWIFERGTKLNGCMINAGHILKENYS